ncbi:MAG: hypothetical protein IPL52_11710 [Flavobacteriales bacterium]|nr:hypothetical protein [Flavobacteriales bacterium]
MTSTRAGMPPLSTLIVSSYDAFTGALVSRTDFANTATPVHYEVLERLAEGVVKTDRTSHMSGERVAKYKYDIHRRAALSVKRDAIIAGVPASVITSYDVDLSQGRVLSTTTPDDLIVSNRYDGLGRPTTRSAPYLDGQPRYDITTTMAWAIETVPGSIYSITTADPGAPRSITYYDGLGRVLEAWTEGYGAGTWSKVKTTYQYDGRIHSVTDPALDGEVVYATESTYDDLGRPDEAAHTLTGTTSWDYEYANGLLLTTTTSPTQQLHKEWKDATGVVVKAEDNGGPIRYEHNSHGQVVRCGTEPSRS